MAGPDAEAVFAGLRAQLSSQEMEQQRTGILTFTAAVLPSIMEDPRGPFAQALLRNCGPLVATLLELACATGGSIMNPSQNMPTAHRLARAVLSCLNHLIMLPIACNRPADNLTAVRDCISKSISKVQLDTLLKIVTSKARSGDLGPVLTASLIILHRLEFNSTQNGIQSADYMPPAEKKAAMVLMTQGLLPALDTIHQAVGSGTAAAADPKLGNLANTLTDVTLDATHFCTGTDIRMFGELLSWGVHTHVARNLPTFITADASLVRCSRVLGVLGQGLMMACTQEFDSRRNSNDSSAQAARKAYDTMRQALSSYGSLVQARTALGPVDHTASLPQLWADADERRRLHLLQLAWHPSLQRLTSTHIAPWVIASLRSPSPSSPPPPPGALAGAAAAVLSPRISVAVALESSCLPASPRNVQESMHDAKAGPRWRLPQLDELLRQGLLEALAQALVSADEPGVDELVCLLDQLRCQWVFCEAATRQARLAEEQDGSSSAGGSEASGSGQQEQAGGTGPRSRDVLLHVMREMAEGQRRNPGLGRSAMQSFIDKMTGWAAMEPPSGIQPVNLPSRAPASTSPSSPAVKSAHSAGAAGAMVCSHCGAAAGEGAKLKRCGRCKVAFYCDENCQAKHWKMGHKVECKAVAK